MKTKQIFNLAVAMAAVLFAGSAFAEVSQEVLDSIMTPDTVETSIGTLKFLDGAPYPETAEKVYDYLDTMRACDAFMKGMPGASVLGLIEGAHAIGAVEAHEVMIFDKLMDTESLFLTGNSSTVYCIPDLDLKRDGPTVVEVPDGLLGAGNDGWFRFINNLPTAGKYLYLPPGYDGPIPDGFAVYRPKTYRIWVFLRSSVKNGDVEAAAALKRLTRSTQTTASSITTSTRSSSTSHSRYWTPKRAGSSHLSGSRKARSSIRTSGCRRSSPTAWRSGMPFRVPLCGIRATIRT
jgi:hypothetical protein